jgi:5-oxoprolinase (ATP-hydrolysing)
VASRGHHADVGGITPGSMPPFSKSLEEEGIAIKSFKIIEGGVFQEQALLEIFKLSRTIKDNVSDLKAQIAANSKGVGLIRELIDEYSLRHVHAYMNFI